MYLSKSDFKVARTCAAKLYYKKCGYPSLNDEDPYLEFLADGGYMVETIAKLLFPQGREIDFGPGHGAVGETMTALGLGDVTLFEATLAFGLLLARVDILEKRGNTFRLIEVKAKGFDSTEDRVNHFRGKRGGIESKWLPYLEDVTFQTHILQSLFPSARVIPCLCLVDKSCSCSIDSIFGKFQITPCDKSGGPKTFSRAQINFIGDVEALRREPLVKIVDVSGEVAELLPQVSSDAAEFSRSLAVEKPERLPPKLGIHCKKCEYRIPHNDRNGFGECWGNLATPSPHLLDLYRIDTLGKNGETAVRMIEAGQCSLLDVSVDDLRDKNGERQAIQLDWTRKGKEFINPELPARLERCIYPLHFLDFESSRMAVPYHAGMRPYEQVIFQWSCHTIQEPGGPLDHHEWINVKDVFPNFEFADSLRKLVGPNGTVFVWSPFERSALKEIRQQMAKYGHEDNELSDWLGGMIHDAGPLIDLCEMAKEFYFHPRMNGSLSIKDVLPVVWFQDEALRHHPWFSDYFREKDGRILEPYESLKPLPFCDAADEETTEVVREGTGAMRTYQEMLYGIKKSDPKFREVQRRLLLNYCKLDTAAMVMIWMHWLNAGNAQ